MNTVQKFLMTKEVADMFRCSEAMVEEELESGRMRAIRIAGEWRIPVESVEAFIKGVPPSLQTVGSQVDSLWNVKSDWNPIEPFSHKWPESKATDPKGYLMEDYDAGYERWTRLGKREAIIVVGFTWRDKPGNTKRRRAVVFLQEKEGGRRIPLVEFAGTDDFEKTGLMASVIKHEGGEHVKPDEPLPIEYETAGVTRDKCGVYSEVIQAKGVSKSMCILARKDELGIMAIHAIVRKQQKERRGLSI